MTGFIDFDAATLDPGVCRCSRCTAPAAPRAPLVALPARHRPRLRIAATGALVAVGGTALALTATSPAGAESAPSHAGWDGHRYWFQRNGEWRWTSHYDIYLSYTSGSGNPAPPKASTPSLSAALAFAEAQLGKPYVWGGNGPNGFDCSGLVQQAFLRAGLHLPRVAVDQYRAARPIAAADLRPGDLLFWSSSSRVTGIHHVAVYLGGGRYIEAPRPGVHVRISILSTGYYPTFFGRVAR